MGGVWFGVVLPIRLSPQLARTCPGSHLLPLPLAPFPSSSPALQRTRLGVELEKVEGQLREARALRKESERDRRVNEALAALKSQYKDRE